MLSKCKSGYKLKLGTCVSCGTNECCGEGNKGDIGEHCHSCTPDMSMCSKCKSGYKLESGTCVLCGPNDCCGEGNTGSGSIGENCHLCSPDWKSCIGCVIGTKLNSIGSCTPCSSDECCPENTTMPITTNCSECSNNQERCMKCQGNLLNSGGVCKEKGKKEEGDGGNSIGIVIGVVAGAVVAITIIIFILIFFTLIPKKDMCECFTYSLLNDMLEM